MGERMGKGRKLGKVGRDNGEAITQRKIGVDVRKGEMESTRGKGKRLRQASVVHVLANVC